MKTYSLRMFNLGLSLAWMAGFSAVSLKDVIKDLKSIRDKIDKSGIPDCKGNPVYGAKEAL